MDNIDRKIIVKLQINGRTTFEELGKIIFQFCVNCLKHCKINAAEKD